MSKNTKRSARIIKKTQLIKAEAMPTKTPGEAAKPTVLNHIAQKAADFRRDEAADSLGESAGQLVEVGVSRVTNSILWGLEHAGADTLAVIAGGAELLFRKVRNGHSVASVRALDAEEAKVKELTAKGKNLTDELTEMGVAVRAATAENFTEGVEEIKTKRAARKAAKIQKRLEDGEDLRSPLQKLRDGVARYTGTKGEAFIDTETLALEPAEGIEIEDESTPLSQFKSPKATPKTALGKLLVSEAIQ